MLPKKDPNSFNERGCSNLSMASVIVIFGVTPFSNSLCPYQITSVLMNSHFDSLRDKVSVFNFIKTSVFSFSSSISDSFESINISSRKQNVFFELFSVWCIALWNYSGISANP